MSAAEVSQGSVVTCLRCGGKYNGSYYKSIAESNSERIFKIHQHLPKVGLRLEWHVFWLTVYICI